MAKQKTTKEPQNPIISSNKKAYFDFLLFDKFEAGICLLGTEIKSIRKHGANLKDSYVKIDDNLEMFLINCHISPYDFGNIFNHEPRRDRKLLLNKKEILKIQNKIKQEKYTIVPTKMYFRKSYLKVEIALAKGKKLFDKRASLKEKDQKRDMERYK